jgi:D-alanyl-lipoteichoic acid acyltransferase DltB (MBOAT superfamily)
MKVVLADGMLAEAANMVFDSKAPLNTLDAWMGALAFSGQIFFDFAGYSSCAIGVAATLGFVLPENFLYPYAAIGFSDFWRRWHITLSAWLRDYLYIPLGGNRLGEFRTHINLMITMLLGGLWHGASWTFVVWGGLHGLFLSIEKLLQNISKKAASKSIAEPELTGTKQYLVLKGSPGPGIIRAIASSKPALALITFFMVTITWVFFRSPDFATAWRLLVSMFTEVKGGAEILTTLAIIKVAVIISAMLACHWVMRNKNLLAVAGNMKWWTLGTVWAAMLLLLILSQESTSSFIYFQF